MNLRKEQVLMVKEAEKAKFLPHGAIQVLIFFGLFLVSQLATSIFVIIQMLYNGTTEIESTGPFNLFIFGVFSFIFILYVLLIEGRSTKSLGFSKRYAIKDYVIGYLVGIGLFSFIMFILYITNSMNYEGLLGGGTLLLVLFFLGFIIQGMSEEVMLRGYLMNSLGARHNLVIATIINSSIFGVLHLLNPNGSVLSILNIILFGVFASVYALKFSNIWGIGALHSAWNFVQGNVFGLEVSGQQMDASILKFSANGNELLNGGSFGPEGGLITTIVLIIATIIIYNLKLNRAAYITK
ncbi:CPBP family intramembrane glutamic endopeptidase [Haloplasma contractile]|uniref:CPBP family intramembrane glutamic endopeptidase n=1 Tax=Haloplasma contractile TaxID=471825 RepID=UPI0002122883|nr:type II CAAX endopeptidase family protein [Haloplasma contractile]